VPDAAVLALALLQLVINARRHDDATEVSIDIEAGPTFRVSWSGQVAPQGVSTARHQADRDRWGLGFVRLTMDALGGVYLSPAAQGSGLVVAVVAIDSSPRLALPLAAIRNSVVDAASPAWDEETHLPPGSSLPQRWQGLVVASTLASEVVQRDGTARARTVGPTTWIAIPPEGTADRARDVIRGMEHESDLLRAPQPYATVIHGLTEVIALLLGDQPHRITPTAFDAEYPVAAGALGLPSLPAAFAGPAAPEPAAVALLAARLGGIVANRNGRLLVQVADSHRSDPIAQRLADASGVIAMP
jgi:hypothetical protein